MPFINLIYEQRQYIRHKERQVRVLLLATVGIGSFLVLTSGYFVFNAARYQVMIGALEAKKEKLEPMLKQLKQNQRDQELLSPKLTSLTSATKATEQWYAIMDHLAVNTPKNLWLTAVKCQNVTGEDSGVALAFSGYSLSLDEIGELLLRLQASSSIEAVALKFTQERVEEKRKVLEFEISAYLAGSRQVKKIKEKESA